MQLDFELLKNAKKLPHLDFTEDNGGDPLGINEFYYNKLESYSNNNLSRVWLVSKKGTSNVIAYFTVSMNAIELEKLDPGEKIPKTTPVRYPAMPLKAFQ